MKALIVLNVVAVLATLALAKPDALREPVTGRAETTFDRASGGPSCHAAAEINGVMTTELDHSLVHSPRQIP